MEVQLHTLEEIEHNLDLDAQEAMLAFSGSGLAFSGSGLMGY
jgi:hypothetical protein